MCWIELLLKANEQQQQDLWYTCWSCRGLWVRSVGGIVSLCCNISRKKKRKYQQQNKIQFLYVQQEHWERIFTKGKKRNPRTVVNEKKERKAELSAVWHICFDQTGGQQCCDVWQQADKPWYVFSCVAFAALRDSRRLSVFSVHTVSLIQCSTKSITRPESQSQACLFSS